jgi:hypothetical protein
LDDLNCGRFERIAPTLLTFSKLLLHMLLEMLVPGGGAGISLLHFVHRFRSGWLLAKADGYRWIWDLRRRHLGLDVIEYNSLPVKIHRNFLHGYRKTVNLIISHMHPVQLRAFSTLSSFGPGMRRRSLLLPSIQKKTCAFWKDRRIWNFGKTGA